MRMAPSLPAVARVMGFPGADAPALAPCHPSPRDRSSHFPSDGEDSCLLFFLAAFLPSEWALALHLLKERVISRACRVGSASEWNRSHLVLFFPFLFLFESNCSWAGTQPVLSLLVWLWWFETGVPSGTNAPEVKPFLFVFQNGYIPFPVLVTLEYGSLQYL